MPRISSQARQHYTEKIKQYRAEIERLKTQENEILGEIAKNPDTNPHRKLELADLNLNIVSYCLLMSSVSKSLLGVKSEEFLNNAKQICHKSLINLEEVVTAFVDAPYSEYEDNLNAIAEFPEEMRLALVNKLGFAIQSIVEGFGENTKWRWSFVEIRGRFAAVTKNLIDMKALFSGLDPRVEGYQERLRHLELTKELLSDSAKSYRFMYEQGPRRIEDFRKSITYLYALRRIHILLGETDQSEALKSRTEVWNRKLTDDTNALEKSGAGRKATR